MSKYLKSFKKYPAGSLIVSKKYGFWKRVWYALRGKKKVYNHIFILPKDSYIGLTKFDKFINDYHVFIPINPYRKQELSKLRGLIKDCKTQKDYLIAIDTVREGSVDINNLDNLRNNKNYRKIYLEQEPFQDIKYEPTEKQHL